MLLTNFINWFRYMQLTLTSAINTSDTTIVASTVGMYNTSGNNTYSFYRSYSNGTSYYYEPIANNFRLNRGLGSIVGTSDTPVQITDYSLTSPTSNVTCSISSMTSQTLENNIIQWSFVITGTNNNTEEVTLKEVGITKSFLASWNDANYTNPTLFIKEILDEPITVSPGMDYVIDLRVQCTF